MNPDWFAQSDEAILPTYDRLPVSFERGEGVYLYDQDENRYIDMLAGIAVNILGYRHPTLVDEAKDAVDDIVHVSNLFYIEEQYKLAEALKEISFDGSAFFCNSGAEANEAAFKFARRYSEKSGSGGRKILSAKNSFHGRTMGALAATGQSKYREGFGPLPEGFEYAEFNDIDAVRSKLDDDYCAIILEPIQGEGGIIPAEPNEFLSSLRELCNERDLLLIFDEIQTGMGRTGSYFAYQEYDVQPDLMTVAKGLAGGFPIGALLARNEYRETLEPGDHASTFGGNPFVTRMARTVIEILVEENLTENASERGTQLRDGLDSISSNYDHVDSPRGKGLMLGLPLHDPWDASEVMHELRSHGLIVGTAGKNSLRFVPPLIITEEEVNKVLDRLDQGFSSYSPN